jgi:XapX domain-containing protein
MYELLAGLLTGVAIGALCRWFDILSPALPNLVGAKLVVAITVGLDRSSANTTRGGLNSRRS